MRTLITLPAALGARFSRLGLREKITVALIAVSLLAGAVIATTSFLVMRAHIIKSTNSLLEAQAQLERREIEHKLGALLAEAAALASNTATANALADSLGRETYLQPLLQSYKLSWPGAMLVLTDHRGEPLAANVKNKFPGPAAKRAIAGMMRASAAFATVESGAQDAHVVSVAFPVVYRLTGTIEGAVLLQFAPENLALSGGQKDWSLHDSAGDLLAGSPAPKGAMQVRSALTLPQAVWSLGLEHTLSIDRDLVLQDLNYLLAAYLAVGLLLVYAAVRLSHAAAAYLSAPLRKLTEAAEAMAASGRPSAWISLGEDVEFNRLAGAFNTMVNRLGESYAELESRVESRTNELESAKLAAERASRLLREAVDSVALGFTIYDENDRLVLCNEAYLELYGMSRDRIVPGASFEEIIRVGIQRGQYTEQQALDDPEGWVRSRLAQHREAKGELIEQKLGNGSWLLAVEYRTASGHTVGNRIDITRLKQTEEALRERTEQLNAVFDLSPDGFVSFDAARRVRYASPAFARLTGLALDSLIDLDEAAFSDLLAAQCLPGATFCGVTALRESARTPEAPARRELIELAGTGGRVLETSLRLSQTPSVSQILYVLDVTREIEIDRMKSEFLSTAAHELRTPMASIFGFSELLLGEDFDAATRRDLIATIHRNADMMASIINELLDLARIEARRGKDFMYETAPAQELVRRIAANFKPPAGREAPLLELPSAPLWLRADPKKMEQAVGNVLSNAYKYSPGGGAVHIALALAGAGGDAAEICLRISDRGIGMKPGHVARVCERFFRADTSGKIPGTGLGMSIVSEILQLHGGRVEIASEFGAGTAVELWLPAAAAPAEQIEAPLE